MNRRGTTNNGTVRRATITAAAVLVLGACSTEDVTERVAEEAIEQQLEDEGGGDVDIDLDDGEVRIEGSDGDIEMSFGEDGVSVISTPDGEFRSGTDLPDDFPDEVPLPDGMTIESAASMTAPEGQTFVVNGTVDGDFQEATDAYAAALEAAGFTQASMTESPDATFFSFGGDGWDVAGGFYPAPSGSGTSFGINVVPRNP